MIGVTLDEDGVCDYCKLNDDLASKYPISEKRLRKMFKRILNETKGDKYNCLIGISGGFDSSFLVHLAVKYGLNPLLVHYDNGWDTTVAKSNMHCLSEKLNLDIIYVKADKTYHKVNEAFLGASVSDADIPNDVALLSVVIDVADRYKIKYNLSGHNFRTESSCPISWTFMNSNYIKDVYELYWKEELKGFPNYSIFKQLYWGLFKNLKTVRPLYHVDPRTDDDRKKMLEEKYGWEDYGAKHCENVYTAFVGNHLLPYKFGIDKRLLYLSALIRQGYITKEDAKKELETVIPDSEHKTVIKDMHKKLGVKQSNKKHNFWDYGDYLRPYTTFKPILWLGTKLGFFPMSFYEKYTREAKLIKDGEP